MTGTVAGSVRCFDFETKDNRKKTTDSAQRWRDHTQTYNIYYDCIINCLKSGVAVPKMRATCMSQRIYPPWTMRHLFWWVLSLVSARRKRATRDAERETERKSHISIVSTKTMIIYYRCLCEQRASGRRYGPAKCRWDLLACSFVRRKPYIFDEIICAQKVYAQPDLYDEFFSLYSLSMSRHRGKYSSVSDRDGNGAHDKNNNPNHQ